MPTIISVISMWLFIGWLSAAAAVTVAGEKVMPEEVTVDLSKLPKARSTQPIVERLYRPLLRPQVSPKVPPPASARMAASVSGPLAPMPSPTNNFAGMSRNDSCTGGTCGDGTPPDANGDVGPNHYIQAVNSSYAIYSKTGTRLAAFTENQLWSGVGTTPCNGNAQGDPVVLYDVLADRWILTHFAFAVDSSGNTFPPYYQCIAASKTSDPVAGGWWMYALRMDPGSPPAGTLNDYGKFGIWHDCLYMAANEFNESTGSLVGTAYASFSRSDLYSGVSLTWSLGFINDASGPFTMIPSNLSGKAALSIPAGTPNYFVSESTTTYGFEVRKFTPGVNCGSGGVLSSAAKVSQASYTSPGVDNVPQPNTTNKLDNLDDRLMQKVQYRKVGANESLWVVHSVQTAAGIVTPQWAQINVTGGTIAATPVQQQIYAPDTTLFRWMGSLAVDGNGNMALGYSRSNGTSPNFPSIVYSGRLASDPLNTLPQTETTLVAGAGSQTNTCGGAPCARWGDYTSMSVDPVDDCTFWYTNQYFNSQANGTSGNWQTRIGSFKFASCGSITTSYSLSLSQTGTGTGTVTSNPAGISCGATCIASFNSGTSVTLAAAAASGSTFIGWSGACTGTGTCVVSMSAAQSVTASFDLSRYTLNVSKAGKGNGIVTSSPSGISCAASCSASYASGTLVTLIAAPAVGSTFSGWLGACSGTGNCVVSMSAAQGVTASFAQINYSLSATKTGTGTGTVISSPSGINCGALCSAFFAGGTSVTLTPTPSAGSGFTGWSGACSGMGACTVTMNQAQNITASFTSGAATTAADVKGASEVVIHVFRVMLGQAPSKSLFVTYTNQIGSSNGYAWANQAVAGFSGMSDSDLATLLMTNLGLLDQLLLHDPLMWYLGAAGVASRGTVVVQLSEIISDLEGDSVWGPAARAFNSQCVIDFNTLLFGP